MASGLHEGAVANKACFAQVNERGGIGGRRIAFFEVDDTYSADGLVKAFGLAMQHRPVAC